MLHYTSKTADVIVFVLEGYLANLDKDAWELTRDRVYERYHDNAREYGFVFRGWTESSVNLVVGVLEFLYGEGDFCRTVQIGTLSGWDSDNGTATIGVLLGLMQGYDIQLPILLQGPNCHPRRSESWRRYPPGSSSRTKRPALRPEWYSVRCPYPAAGRSHLSAAATDKVTIPQ